VSPTRDCALRLTQPGGWRRQRRGACTGEERLVLLLQQRRVAFQTLQHPHRLNDVETFGVIISAEARRDHPTGFRVLRRRGEHTDSVFNHALDREVRHHGTQKVVLGERLLVGLPHGSSLVFDLPAARMRCLRPVQVPCHTTCVPLLLVNA